MYKPPCGTTHSHSLAVPASPVGSVTSPRRPSAILAISDLMAIGVLQELRRQGMRVPDDISVVGIDDIAVAQSLAPALTTVAVPLTEMGEIAFGMLRKPAAGRPRRRIVPAYLVVRESTARV